MKSKLTRYLARVLCLTIILSSFVFWEGNSITAEAALLPLKVVEIDSLDEIDEKVNADEGLFEYDSDTYQFEVSERGWLLYIHNYNYPSLYTNASLTNSVNSIDRRITVTGDTRVTRQWYIEPGTYYLGREWYSIGGWLFFLPDSSLAKLTATRTSKSNENIKISSPYSIATMVDSDAHNIRDGYNDNMWRGEAVQSSLKNNYNLTSNGTYSVRVSFSEGDLKNFPIVITHKVKGIVKQKSQKLKASVPSKTYKYASVKRKSKSFTIGITGNKGKLSYSVSSNGKKYIKVTSKGKVTVKKGAKKGTYKITVTAAAKGNYKKTTKTIVVKVK